MGTAYAALTPRCLEDVRTHADAERWFNEVSRNTSFDLIRRIETNALTPEDTMSSKVGVIKAAWLKLLEFSNGAFLPKDGPLPHIPA